jgi:hypothetical protein
MTRRRLEAVVLAIQAVVFGLDAFAVGSTAQTLGRQPPEELAQPSFDWHCVRKDQEPGANRPGAFEGTAFILYPSRRCQPRVCGSPGSAQPAHSTL